MHGQISHRNDGTGIAADDNSAYVDIYYNLSYGNDGPGIGVWKANNVNVYNNTCYGNSRDSGSTHTGFSEIAIGSNVADVRNIVVKNNIGRATGANTYAVSINNNVYKSSTLTISNNNWYATAANWYYWNNAGGNNLSTWKALTGVQTDLNSDPLFVSTADFKLKPVSLCINKGTDVGLTKDYNNLTVPSGTAPDIGACEYQPAVAVSAPSMLRIFTP